MHARETDGVQYIATNTAAGSGINLDAVGSFYHLLQVAVRDNLERVAPIRADAVEPLQPFSPENNEDLFALTRELKTSNLTLVTTRANPDGYQSHRVLLPITTRSTRAVTHYLTCTSGDGRWYPQRLISQLTRGQ